MPIAVSIPQSGGSASLPPGASEGVLQYTTPTLTITAASVPPGGGDTVTINSSNNTIVVTVTDESDTTLLSYTYIIPSAQYPATLACLATLIRGPIDWTAESGKVVARLSRGYFATQAGLTLTLSGNALVTLGFTESQSAQGSATESWLSVPITSEPGYLSLETRVSSIEDAYVSPPVLGYGPRGLVVPGAWVAPITGTTGTQALGLAGGSPRVIRISPLFLSRSIQVTEVGYEVSTQATASNPYEVVLYRDGGVAGFDWPGQLVFRQTVASGTTTGFKSATLPSAVTLQPGLYFIGVGGYDFSGNTENSCVLVTNSGIGGIMPGLLGAGVGPSGTNGGRAASGIVCTSWQDRDAAFPAPTGTGVAPAIQTSRAYMR